MSKKFLPLFIFSLIVALALAACGGSATTTQAPAASATAVAEPAAPQPEAPAAQAAPVTLTILHSISPDESKAPIFDEIVADFMAANPNIRVEVEVVPDVDLATKVQVAFLGGVEPDIVFQNYPLETANWVYDGLTVPLTEELQAWGLSNTFYEIALEEYTNRDGQLAAFPMEGFTWPIWFNQAIFTEAGVEIPLTIADLIAVTPALRQTGYQPFVTGGSDWTGARLFMLIMSAHMSADEFESLLKEGGYANSPGAVAAIENFVAMRDAGVFVDNVEGLEYSSMNEMFFSGRAAMMHGGSWTYGDPPETIVNDIVLGGFPLPSNTPHSNPVMFGAFGAKGLHVTRNGANNMDAVQRFVTHFYQPELFVRFVNETGMVAPVRDLPVDASRVPQLFADSLSLPERTEFGGNPDLVPPDITAQWDQIANSAYIPGNLTAVQIISALDELYQ